MRSDPRHPSGGHAILAGPNLVGVSAISVENVYANQFLAPDGQWGKRRCAFPVGPVPDDPKALRLGPEIVDFILTDLMVDLRAGDGTMLGRVIWPDTVVPRRDGTGAKLAPGWREGFSPEPGPEAPVPAPIPPPPEPPGVADDGAGAEDDAVPVDEIAPPHPGDDAEAPVVASRRRWPWAVGAACLLLAAGAYALLNRPPAPQPVDLARQCSETYDARVAAAQDASDNDRVALAEAAIGASCGLQAFRAVDGTRWDTNEAAAWYQARFYDPNETAPVFRAAHTPDPRAAFDYYAVWADRSPRQAEALKRLCGTNPAVIGDNVQRQRACAR